MIVALDNQALHVQIVRQLDKLAVLSVDFDEDDVR